MYLLCRLLLFFSAGAAGYSLVAIGSGFGPIGTIVAVIGMLGYVGKRGRQRLSACGTSRWADEDDARRAGMFSGGSGLIVGQLDSDWRPSVLQGLTGLINPTVSSRVACRKFLKAVFRRWSDSPPLVKLSQAVHTCVVAPTGVGKNVSCATPFLFDCRESCVVVDFKGELARTTAAFRRRKFGHRIVLLDPFKQVSKTPDTFNPLDFIRKESETAIDDCRDLAQSLVIRDPQERERHWGDSAEAWISAMVAAVVQFGDSDDRSLQSVRELLGNPKNIEAAIKLLCESDAWGGFLSRLGFQLTHFKDKELSSTLTTTNRFMRYLDTPAIAASTGRSSFDPSDLCRGKMTVYLVLPPEHVRAQSSLLRMWIGAMLRAVVRGGLQERKKVHFILDEAATLGHLEQLDDAVDKYRGFGVRLMFLYQSLGQLKKCFPEGADQTLLSNCTQVFFGVNDPQTAEYVSNRLGEETIIVNSGGVNRGASFQTANLGQESSSRSRGGSENWQQQARKLLKPEEVMALPERTAITFIQGVPPIRTTLTRYFEWRKVLWGRVKTAFATLVLSVSLFGFCGMLAVAFSAPETPQGRQTRPVQRGVPKPQQFSNERKVNNANR